MSKYVFGIDVGGTTIKLGLFSEEGKMQKKWEIPTRTENKGEKILTDVAGSIRKTMNENRIRQKDVLGVGIGTPGLVDVNGTVREADNLNWETFNIPQVLGGLLDLPVRAANDANVAAFGELFQGAGKGHKNIVMVTLGTGVGGGIISDGQILTGAIGAGGEIGHIHIEDNETEVCSCGCVGCLEQYASATGITKIAIKHLAASDKCSVLREYPIVSAKTVFDAVKGGDPLAIEIAREFGYYLGKGLAIIAAMANPEMFIIGGGVSKAGEVLFDYICPAYKKYAFSSIKNTQFKLAMLGNEAGIYGAAGLILSGKGNL